MTNILYTKPYINKISYRIDFRLIERYIDCIKKNTIDCIKKNTIDCIKKKVLYISYPTVYH